jgi:AraC-like DNA-binding protein
MSQINELLLGDRFGRRSRTADLIERYPDGDGRHCDGNSTPVPVPGIASGGAVLFTHSIDAACARHTVGYESPSQFSRDYRRLFGAPPVRGIERLRASASDMVAA